MTAGNWFSRAVALCETFQQKQPVTKNLSDSKNHPFSDSFMENRSKLIHSAKITIGKHIESNRDSC